MSVASTSRTIKFISKAGTYTATIISPSGDLFQEYQGYADADGAMHVTSILPNFETVKPTLNFVCTSSRVAEGVVTPVDMQYYFNGEQITFDSNGLSTGTFAGIFKRLNPTGSNLYYGLQILKNIVVASNFAPAIIKMVATITYGTQRDSIQADYTIPIQQSTGSSYKVTIASGDSKNFVLSSKEDSCILSAKVYLAGELVTSGLSYKWEQLTTSGWSTIGTAVNTLTVTASMIDTYGEFRLTAYINGTELEEKDIQGVIDASDPYDINPGANPADETIDEDETSTRASVTYTPKIVKRGTNTQVLSGTLFYFIVKDAAGVILNSNYTTKLSNCTVTRAQCLQAGGDLSITITSAD